MAALRWTHVPVLWYKLGWMGPTDNDNEMR